MYIELFASSVATAKKQQQHLQFACESHSREACNEFLNSFNFTVSIVMHSQRESQKLSGLRPKQYLSSYETVKKQLGISSHVGARELGVKLGCLAAVELAEEVLRRYKGGFLQEKYTAAQREGLDLEKPLYPAAALYCSCKSVSFQSHNSLDVADSPPSEELLHSVPYIMYSGTSEQRTLWDQP